MAVGESPLYVLDYDHAERSLHQAVLPVVDKEALGADGPKAVLDVAHNEHIIGCSECASECEIDSVCQDGCDAGCGARNTHVGIGLGEYAGGEGQRELSSAD